MPFGPEDQLTALEALEHQGGNMSKWEEQFVASLREQVDEGRPLTERQRETLERIYRERVCR